MTWAGMVGVEDFAVVIGTIAILSDWYRPDL